MSLRDRQDVMAELNSLNGFEQTVIEYGNGELLAFSPSDGVSSYEAAKIRQAGYEWAYYDEVNDDMVIQPQNV